MLTKEDNYSATLWYITKEIKELEENLKKKKKPPERTPQCLINT